MEENNRKGEWKVMVKKERLLWKFWDVIGPAPGQVKVLQAGKLQEATQRAAFQALTIENASLLSQAAPYSCTRNAPQRTHMFHLPPSTRTPAVHLPDAGGISLL